VVATWFRKLAINDLATVKLAMIQRHLRILDSADKSSSSFGDDGLNLLELLVCREIDNGTKSPLSHDRCGQGIAKGGNGLSDLGREPEEPQDLGNPGSGDPQVPRYSRRRDMALIGQGLLPVLRQNHGIPIMSCRGRLDRIRLFPEVWKLKLSLKSSSF
jgi:hypothetical protein